MTAPLIDETLPASLNPRRTSDRSLSKSLHRKVWTDRWGRKWPGTAHRDTQHPVGGFNLDPRYHVPHEYLVPPPEFRKFSDDGDGFIDIRLEEWQQATANAWGIWKRRLYEAARKLYSDRAAEEAEKMNPDLMQIVGPPPLHEKFLAAMQLKPDGTIRNRWVLGMVNPETGRMDPTPAWATVDLLDTLRKHETFAGGATPSAFNLDEFNDPDPTTADTVARLDGAAKYETLEDEIDPPVPPRNRGQFTKKNP